MAEHLVNHPQSHPRLKRRALWAMVLLGVLGLIGLAIIEQVSRPAAISYGSFLDQLETGNVASVSFRGTEIEGRFRQAKAGAQDAFRTRAPDFGDPSLIPELRHRQVAIDVVSSTSWLRLLGGIPLPMLFFIGAFLVAGVVRLVRGKKDQNGPTVPMHPMQGVMALLSGLFSTEKKASTPSSQQDTRDGAA